MFPQPFNHAPRPFTTNRGDTLFGSFHPGLMKRLLPKVLALLLAALIWLPALHLLLGRASDAVAAPLARRQLMLWTPGHQHERDDLRSSNPEWELMRRTFDVLAFGNLALAHPAQRPALLQAIDRILDTTLEEERLHGQRHFLLSYGRQRPFVDVEGRSLFVDGEIALMLATRQLVERDGFRQHALDRRVTAIVGQLERAPLLAGESYPDEAWTFCNVVALVAIRSHDAVTGQDHGGLIRRWLASARAHLLDHRTGLLVSSFSLTGRVKDGPEGSSLWLVAPFLRLLDPPLAEEQYRRAKQALARQTLGFAWAREWPASWPGAADIDSGPTVPLVGANAGSSGMALVAARAFGDEDFLRGLVTSLELAGFPIDEHGQRRYAAGNDLADAVILYAMVQGPLGERLRGAP